MAELKAMAKNGKIEELLGRLHAYTANVVGSDAYWSKKRRELEAIMQQKGLGTAFFTFSFKRTRRKSSKAFGISVYR